MTELAPMASEASQCTKMEGRTILEDLAMVLLVAGTAALVFQRLRQPVVLAYLLAGLVIGPHLGLGLFADVHRIELLAELGVILVIFSIGLEFRLSRLAKVLPTAGMAGVISITAMIWLGYSLGRLAGMSGTESLFVGGMVSVSSTMIVARVLADRDDDPRLADHVFGILVIQDLAAIVLIAVFTAIASGAGLPASQVARIVGELALFLVATGMVGLLIVPRVIREAHHRGSHEVLLITSIGVCFGLALLADRLGYSVALGAFVAGSVVGESGRRNDVERLSEPIRDLFAAVFFVSIGMLVDPRAIAENWKMILAVSALVVFGQSIAIALGSFLAGRSLRIAVRSGLTLAQIGEFSFIIVGVGMAGGAVGPELLAVAVGVAVVTTFLTPFLVASSERFAIWFEHKLPRPLQTFASLYASWFDSLRSRPARPRSGRRRYIALLLVDGVAIAAAIVVAALWRDSFAARIASRLDISYNQAVAAVAAATLLIVLPFAIGLARIVRRVGIELATTALPQQSGVDLADAPRRAFIVALQLAVALAVLLPLVALTQPFLPLYAGAACMALVLVYLGVRFWRRAMNLDGHVQAGAEVVLAVLQRQRRADADDHTDQIAVARPSMPELLPGLGPLVNVTIEPDSPGVGKTLAQLNLRALTGATVIAIGHTGGVGVSAPSGDETLREGDLLTLTGSNVSIERAREVLSGVMLPALGDPVGD